MNPSNGDSPFSHFHSPFLECELKFERTKLQLYTYYLFYVKFMEKKTIVTQICIDDVLMTAKRSESESLESSNTRSTNTTLAVIAPEYKMEKL